MCVHTATLCAGGLYCRHIEFPFSFYADVDVTRCCYERRGVAASTRIPDPDEITVDTSGAQVSATGAWTLAPDIIPARYSTGNAGCICIFLQLQRWSNVSAVCIADRHAGQRPFFLQYDTPEVSTSGDRVRCLHGTTREYCHSGAEIKPAATTVQESFVQPTFPRLIGLASPTAGSIKDDRSYPFPTSY